ncbi:FAD-dependent oxidoreductase [Galenea microaerophila]
MENAEYKAKASAEVDYEVVVVGGGMVGAATALGLAQEGLKVLLLEKAPPLTEWSHAMPYQTRVSALTRASENILRNLGAWQGIEARRNHPFVAMHIWESLGGEEIQLTAAEVGAPNLGYVVENVVIQAALWEACEKNEYIEFLLGDEIKELKLNENSLKKCQNSQSCQPIISLDMKQKGTLTTHLLVGADGAFSQVRSLAHIGLDTHDYQQCAVVGCVKTEASHQDVCWQRYIPEGPFAFLAMDENVSSIAWYLPLEKMQWALSLSDEAFAQAVTEASGRRLGQVVEVAERTAFPLVRRHAQHYIQPGLALVGDAAHTIHPQAGQGVNLGLLDAAALIEVVTDAKGHQRPFASYATLRKYERWRKGDNVIVQRSMEFFDGLFRQQPGLRSQLRHQLMPALNLLQPIKQWLIREALYGRKPLPKLAKIQ